ncbi:MAG TPA: PHB depolymerase family esterase [Lautropia sp.]|nr:PHB depolymerase family esterase [Lautropia sp.]
MNQNLKSAMLAAAGLTAAGDLNGATALIQRALAGDLPAAAAEADSLRSGSLKNRAATIDVEAQWLPDGAEPAAADPKVAAVRPVGNTPAAAAPEVRAAPAAAVPTAGEVPHPPIYRTSPKPDWQAFAARMAAKAADFQRTEGEQPRHDWQAFAADMASKAAAFQQANAETSTRPNTPQAHGGKGQLVSGTFTAPAGSRDYLLYLPEGDAPASGRPLVVMLHGCTQTPADFAAGTAMNELADQHGFVVLYPGQSKGANQSACWNWFNPRDQRAGGGEPSIIAGMVREVASRNGVDPTRIGVAGLSAGGAMAAILADAYPDLFTAVAVHSGLPAGAAHDLPSALSAMKRGAAASGAAGGPAVQLRRVSGGKPVRTIVFHGRQDKTVHPSNGRQVVDAALAAWSAQPLAVQREEGRSAGGRSFIRTIHTDAAGKPVVEQWEVQGAGHAWSGGSKSGSYTDPQGPDASGAIVAFFMAS